MNRVGSFENPQIVLFSKISGSSVSILRTRGIIALKSDIISIWAKCIHMHASIPWPKPKWLLFFRVMLKSSSFLNTLLSRLAEKKSIITQAPFGIETSKNSKLSIVVWLKLRISEPKRIAPFTALLQKAGFALNKSHQSGLCESNIFNCKII